MMISQTPRSSALCALVLTTLVGSTDAQAPYCVAQAEALVPASAGALDGLGRAVAFDGSWAALGASLARRVTMYSKVDVNWTEEVDLAPAAAGGGFGSALALDGDFLAVGAPFDDVDGADAGAVTLFEFDGSNWLEGPTLRPTTPVVGRRFGTSLALDGDRLVVGAPGDTIKGVGGAAYLFENQNGLWTEVEELTASTGSIGGFGAAVAVDGDELLVGSPEASLVHPFFLDMGAWLERATLSTGVIDDGLGFAVDLEGTTALIGAPFDSTFGEKLGAAYLAELDMGAWSLVDTFRATDGVPKDSFGVAVDLDGVQFVVSSSGAPIAGSSGTLLPSGHAYLYRDDSGSFVEQARLDPTVSESGMFFGRAIAASDNAILIGSAGSSANGILSGAVNVFRSGASQEEYGAGTPGTDGFVPRVSLVGCAAPNTGFDIVVNDGIGGGLGLLVWSDQPAAFPILGGTLLVNVPILNQLPHQLGGSIGVGGEGSFAFPASVANEGVAGFKFYMQAGYLDAEGPSGFSFSTGLEIEFPTY